MARILVVEDNPDLGDVLSTFIRSVGHTVTLCNDGHTALDTINEEHFDLVITDMFMPDLDGLDILRETRRVAPDTPVMAMSGGSRLLPRFDPLNYARKLGAVAILHKPFRRADLLSRVGVALDNKPSRHAARPASTWRATR